MSDNTIEPYTGLLTVIDLLSGKLLDYSKTPNANQGYIDRQKAIITDLLEVSDSLKFYDLHPAWTHIQDMIDNTLKSDPSIEAFQININLKEVTNHISVIDVNLY